MCADALPAFARGPEAGEAAREPFQSGFSGCTVTLSVLLPASPSLSWNTMGTLLYSGGTSSGFTVGPLLQLALFPCLPTGPLLTPRVSAL